METTAETLTTTMNLSIVCGNESRNGTCGYSPLPPVDAWAAFFAAMYTLICLVGLVGNGLVIFVVVRYTKMKTVTNMYILNLAVADLCFLIGMPFLIVTLILRHWVFGNVMCKLFYISTSINWFTSVFTLTVMSADRYVAVCHAIQSLRYRTPLVSRIVCACIWSVSLLVMLPIILYARTLTSEETGRMSCTIMWPEDQLISADVAFIWYAALLGFAIPVALIIVFYTLVVVRLKSVGPKSHKSKEKKKSHRKVTKMVLTVIAVYVICWLPYWLFQVILTLKAEMLPPWTYKLYQIITMLSYANSMLNPVLYAFLSDNFRQAFIKAFKCADLHEVNGTLQAEQSVFPGRNRTQVTQKKTSCVMCPARQQLAVEEEELEVMTTTTATNTTHDLGGGASSTGGGGVAGGAAQGEDVDNVTDTTHFIQATGTNGTNPPPVQL